MKNRTIVCSKIKISRLVYFPSLQVCGEMMTLPGGGIPTQPGYGVVAQPQ